MTALVPLLVPPITPPRADAHGRPQRACGRPLPLPVLIARRARATVYGLASVDDRGRVADRTVVRALGWTERTRLAMRVDTGQILVTAVAAGRYQLTGRDRVPLPAPLRRGCGIEPGDRVLLAAEPADWLLVVYPLSSLDAMLKRPVPAWLGDHGR